MSSKEQNQESTSEESQIAAASVEAESKEQYVARRAYEEVASDMHKYKQQLRQEKARISELEVKLKSQEEDKLKEQQQWKELYEREVQQREEVLTKAQQQQAAYTRTMKMSALKAELGGKIKDAYLGHAALDEIEVTDDGLLSPESVKAVANKFRQEHSQLIPPSNVNQITNQAPGSAESLKSSDKTLTQMNYEEKVRYLESLKSNRR